MSSVTWVNGFLLSASHSPSLSGSYFPACPCPALKHFLPNIHSHNTAYGGNDRHLQNIITHSEWSLFSQTKEVSTAVLWTLSLWLLRKSRWNSTRSGEGTLPAIVLAAVHGLLGLPGRCARSNLHSFSPPPPPFPSLKSHLASVDIKQNVYSLTKQTRADHTFL